MCVVERYTDKTSYKPFLVGTGIIMTLLIVILTTYLFRVPVYAALTTAKLIPIPESFTELSIADPTHIPTIISPDKAIQFSFTIHNHENRTMTYPYQVALSTGGALYIIDEKNITLANNTMRTIHESFEIVNPPATAEVVITLMNKQQSIDFFLHKSI